MDDDEAAAADPGGWTRRKMARGREDISAYLAYIQRSAVAVVDSVDLPLSADMPYLRRQDLSVWQAPDEPYFVDEDEAPGC